MANLLARIEQGLAQLARAAGLLALPVAFLLFVQWPLRESIGAWSTQANDLAQSLFALYVGVALRHAHVRGAHLTARPDLMQGAGPWRRLGAALCTLPFGIAVALAAWPGTRESVATLESFPETGNPGYFMVRVALLLMALLVVLQGLIDILRAWQTPAPAA